MTVKYSIGFLMLLVCCLAEVSSRPSNESSENEDTTIKASTKAVADTEDGSISYQDDSNINVEETTTKDIVEKIKTINSFLNKPSREQLNLNKPSSDKPPGIDRETLLKIQQIIASAKLTKDSIKNQEQQNYFLNEDEYRKYYSRSSKQIPNYFYQSPMIPYISNPYTMNVPVVPSPSYNEMLGYATNNNLKSVSNGMYQTRQQQPFFPGFPSFPTFSSFPSFSLDNFQPFAQLFPVLIKNPFVAFSQGGGLDNFVEYGQSADVCNRKQKSSSDTIESNVDNLQEPHLTENNNNDIGIDNTISEKTISRKSRALNKRTVSTKATEQEIEEGETGKKIYASKPSITRKPSKRPSLTESSNDLKQSDPEGDLRFPFSSDFTWFWNKKPVAPSPGFFINKLKVRRGGVAIAGPGGIATAGKGGTAIVGPGGLAYTKPGGLAIAGPHARVVALSPYSDLFSSLTRPHQQGYDFRALQSIREGKIVATGPVIYYHPIEQI